MNISVKLHNALNNDLNNKKSEYKIEKNTDGFIIAYKNNRAVHSKYNIENECKRALEKINKNKNLLIIYGYGLGYIIKYLIENIENYFDKKILESLKIIVVVEDDYLFKYSSNQSIVSLSKWLVGSARINNSQGVIKAEARETLFLCPPDNSFTF